jgi:nicotinate-nucleotide pyrophosphorylase (carboxylating)
MLSPRSHHLIDLALEEDAALGDLTSRLLFPDAQRSRAVIEAREDLVVCGTALAQAVFARVDARVRSRMLVADGAALRRGDRVLEVAGPTISLLTAERVALNFLQRLSGVATRTRRFVDAVSGTGVRVVDTRKTLPGWRALEREAVRCGGGANHRSSLGEHVLIKDNHLAAAGSLREAVRRCREGAPHLAKIEVEVETMAQVREACAARAEVILLDNFTPAQVRRAVEVIAGRALVEVSGGVRLENVREYALPGVSVISVGSLTHSAAAVDLSLEFVRGRSV